MFLIAPSSSVAAQDNKLNLPKPTGENTPRIDSGGMILQMIFALGITVLVIWLVYKALRVWNRKSSGGIKNSAAVEVLSRTEIDRDMTVYVLKLGDTVSAVSRTSQGATLLKEMSLEEAQRDGLTTSINPSSQSIVSVFNELKRRRSRPAGEPIDIDSIIAEAQPAKVDELLDGPSILTVDQLLDDERESE